VFRNKRGEWDIHTNNRSKENMASSKSAFGELWLRIKDGRCK